MDTMLLGELCPPADLYIVRFLHNKVSFYRGVMIKAPHKWRDTFIMTSFRWKLAYQMPLLISLRSGGRMSSFNAARIVGEPQAATGLNECTSEGSGWRRKSKPRKAWLLRSVMEQQVAQII